LLTFCVFLFDFLQGYSLLPRKRPFFWQQGIPPQNSRKKIKLGKTRPDTCLNLNSEP
jgi:hypothetical protein